MKKEKRKYAINASHCVKIIAQKTKYMPLELKIYKKNSFNCLKLIQNHKKIMDLGPYINIISFDDNNDMIDERVCFFTVNYGEVEFFRIK